MKKIYLLFESLLLALIKKIPAKALAHIKQKTQIIKKMDYLRHDIFLHIDSTFEYNARLTSCGKEPETVWWIENFLKEGEVFYDIGANVGAYSLVAAKFLNNKVKIYAFEPAFMSYAQLCKNITLNNCEDNIIPIPIALSDKTAIDTFNYRSFTTGSSIHELGRPIDHAGRTFKPFARHQILACTLDDAIQYFNLAMPNHIKIDVDGIELKILKGVMKTLQNPGIKSILLEINKGNAGARATIEFFRNNGFRFHSEHPNDKPYNYIFTKL